MDILIEFFDFANEVTLVNGTPDLVGVDRPPATVDEPLVFGIDETIERRWGRKIAAKGVYA